MGHQVTTTQQMQIPMTWDKAWEGKGSAPPIWGLTADVTLSTYRKHGVGAKFTHPSGNIEPQTDHASKFMDDSTLTCNKEGISAQAQIQNI